MRRTLIAALAAMAVVAFVAVPAVGAKEFGRLYAEDQVFRTFATPANVPPGTGRDPIFTFENTTNPDQFSVARYAPGHGSHGGRWAVSHVTWTTGDPNTLVTSYDQLIALANAGQLTIVRDEAADFRCPILPNG
jgi:hypothetical protein